MGNSKYKLLFLDDSMPKEAWRGFGSILGKKMGIKSRFVSDRGEILSLIDSGGVSEHDLVIFHLRFLDIPTIKDTLLVEKLSRRLTDLKEDGKRVFWGMGYYE